MSNIQGHLGCQSEAVRFKPVGQGQENPVNNPPGLNSFAPGLKEKLFAKGLSFEAADIAEPGVDGWPPDSATAAPLAAESAPAASALPPAPADLPFVGGVPLATEPAADAGGDGAAAASDSGVACSEGDSADSEAEAEEGPLPPSLLKVRSRSRSSSRLQSPLRDKILDVVDIVGCRCAAAPTAHPGCRVQG